MTHVEHVNVNLSFYADLNECNTGNGGCNQICTNSIGSFLCSCNSGYNLAADGRTCVDINECQLNTDNCQQTCTNTAGGFTCSCNSGFALNSNGRTCDGELSIFVCVCVYVCVCGGGGLEITLQVQSGMHTLECSLLQFTCTHIYFWRKKKSFKLFFVLTNLPTLTP